VPPSPPPPCGDESSSGDGADYRGCQTTTRSGETCQAWTAQSPHSHSRTPSNYPNSGLVGNYCRNPDGEPTIWCYTTDPDKRWAYCDAIASPPSPAAIVSPSPPPALDNLGTDCWGQCGTGGACPEFCGTEGLCCRLGWTSDPAECGNGANGERGKGHVCVAPMPPSPPVPPPSPPSPPPKTCTNTIVSQTASYCDSTNTQRSGKVADKAACQARCEADEDCKFFSFWDTTWCKVTSDCDTIGEQSRYKIDIVACDNVDSPPPSPPSPPPLPPTSTTEWLGTSSLIVASANEGYIASVHVTTCELNGRWVTGTGVVVKAAATGSSGLGTYYCSLQDGRHLKMVQFEVTKSYSGDVYAKVLAAGYTVGRSGESASEEEFASKRDVNIATSTTDRGYGIESLTLYTTLGAAPPSPPAPPPSFTSGAISSDSSTSGTLLQSGVTGGHPTGCTLDGSWVSDTDKTGTVSPLSSSDSTTGLGTYVCGMQSGRWYKMVEFELTLSSTGELYALATAAGRTRTSSGSDPAEEWESDANIDSPLAASATKRGYMISSITYYKQP